MALRGDRRTSSEVLDRLDALLQSMHELGVQAHDASGRITDAIRSPETRLHPELMDALSDVIHVVTERTRLADEAHRLLTQMRRREQDRLNGAR